jgi:peptide/nickel transport system substrate-binding protein
MLTRRAVLVSGSALAVWPLLPGGQALAATDQLRLTLNRESPHLDPVTGNDPSTLAVSYQNLFEGLTRIDERNQVQPGLARSWGVSSDGLTYR